MQIRAGIARDLSALIAGLALLAGCGTAPPAHVAPVPHACTLIGAESGVSVTADIRGVSPSSPATISGSADGMSKSQTVSTVLAALFIPVPSLAGGPVKVTASIVTSDGRHRGGTAIGVARRAEPNGPGCGPVVWQAHVVIHADGTVTG